MATVDKSKVPWWVSNLIVPLVNLILALFVSGLFIFIAGENPYEAVRYEFGANAFYFNLPYEFGDYMDWKIEEQLEWWNREALEDFVKLVEKKVLDITSWRLQIEI